EETPRQEARRAGKPAEETPRQEARRAGNLLKETRPQIPVRIAVARDEAFNFYYEDNLELLREYGAEPVFFSPLHDTELPEADGLILGGGYPELHARALAENERMKAQIRARAAEGMPVLAECGGFMYLQESLQLPADEEQNPPAGSMESPAGSLESSAGSRESPPGSPESPPGSLESSSGSRESSAGSTDSTAGFPGLQEYAMCGVLRGTCRKTDRLVRFGYLALSRTMEDTAEGAGSGYLPAESAIRGHEFHYFDSTHNGSSCTAVKPDGKRSWKCMVIEGNIMAGFPHLYYRSNPAFARNFLDRCRTWAGKPGHSAR
ncbi:MAG: hypothetical protein Q4D81_06490, partial [Eubacteriales bacterium]|nr:hypothetical protein [Eubacteriales bacterium]